MRILACLIAAGLIAGSLPALAADNAIAVEQAWTRATPPAARAAGGFATIRNAGPEDDRLVGASSPIGTVEIHTMEMNDGVMKMRHLPDGLAVPAGGMVELKPGSYHLMFIDLAAPVVEGSPVPVTLQFEKAGEVTVEMFVAPIGARAPQGMQKEGMQKGGMDHGGMKHDGMKKQ